MNSIQARVNAAFGDMPRPSRIAVDDVGESQAIEDDFQAMTREDMTYADASMMLVDAALISDRALAYFLPRLAHAVLTEGGNAFLLARRLEMFDRRGVSEQQEQVIDELLRELREIDRLRDADEAEDLEAGRVAWRRARMRSGLAEDDLLLAAERGDIAKVAELLRSGADPKYHDELGNTAVELARLNGHDAVIELLSRVTN